MIATSFIKQGYKANQVLKYVGLSASTYYYKAKANAGKKGCINSEYTLTKEGEVIPNEKVVEQIRGLLSEEFVDYGYLKVTWWLRRKKSYVINPKKVYRLMRDANLLNRLKPQKKGQRNWVKELLPQTNQAFDFLEFDIKYIYIAGLNRNALLLTIIDVNTRWVLGQYLGWKIKEKQVIQLFDQIFEDYPLPNHFHVRNDNGSQFIAKAVQTYFDKRGVTQEFCKPATPQQNAHIESYHSILEKVVCQQYEFEHIEECQQTLNRFIQFYNFERIHSGVKYQSPYDYLLESEIDMTDFKTHASLNCSSLEKIVLQEQ